MHFQLPDASQAMISTTHQSLAGIMRDFKEFSSWEISKWIETMFESRHDWTLLLFGEMADLLNGSRIARPGSGHTELLTKANITRQRMDQIHDNSFAAEIRESLSAACIVLQWTISHTGKGIGLSIMSAGFVFEGGLQRATRQ